MLVKCKEIEKSLHKKSEMVLGKKYTRKLARIEAKKYARRKKATREKICTDLC